MNESGALIVTKAKGGLPIKTVETLNDLSLSLSRLNKRKKDRKKNWPLSLTLSLSRQAGDQGSWISTTLLFQPFFINLEK